MFALKIFKMDNENKTIVNFCCEVLLYIFSVFNTLFLMKKQSFIKPKQAVAKV